VVQALQNQEKKRATLLLNREPKRSSSKNSWSCQNPEKTISKWRLKTRTTQLSQAHHHLQHQHHHPSRWIFAWTLQESLSPSRIIWKSFFSESQNTPPPQPTNTQSMSLNYLSPLTIIISRKLTTSTRVLKKALLWHFMWHPCLRLLCSPPLLIENEKTRFSLILLQHTANSIQVNST